MATTFGSGDRSDSRNKGSVSFSNLNSSPAFLQEGMAFLRRKLGLKSPRSSGRHNLRAGPVDTVDSRGAFDRVPFSVRTWGVRFHSRTASPSNDIITIASLVCSSQPFLQTVAKLATGPGATASADVTTELSSCAGGDVRVWAVAPLPFPRMSKVGGRQVPIASVGQENFDHKPSVNPRRGRRPSDGCGFELVKGANLRFGECPIINPDIVDGFVEIQGSADRWKHLPNEQPLR